MYSINLHKFKKIGNLQLLRYIRLKYNYNKMDSSYTELHSHTTNNSYTDQNMEILLTIRQIIEETIHKTPLQLQQNARMNLQIAEEILRCPQLTELRSMNSLKAVLFELIILLKSQSLAAEKNRHQIQYLQVKMEANLLKRTIHQLRDTISQASVLLEQTYMTFNQCLKENKQLNLTSKNKYTKTMQALKDISTIRNILNEVSLGNQHVNKKEAIIDKLEQNLRLKHLELLQITDEFKHYRLTHETLISELREQLSERNLQIEMLRNRISCLIEQQPTYHYADDLLNMVVIQSQTLQKLIR